MTYKEKRKQLYQDVQYGTEKLRLEIYSLIIVFSASVFSTTIPRTIVTFNFINYNS